MAFICAEYSSLFVFIISEMKLWHMNFMLCIYTPDEMYSFSYTSSIKVCIQKSCVQSTQSCIAKSWIKHHEYWLFKSLNTKHYTPVTCSVMVITPYVSYCQWQNIAALMQHFKFQSAGVFCRSHWAFRSGTRGWSITNCENYFHSTWYATLPSMQ
jgi:hypothetical protein